MTDFSDLEEMLDDIARYTRATGHSIVSADEAGEPIRPMPRKRGRMAPPQKIGPTAIPMVGYRSVEEPEKSWHIQASTLHRGLDRIEQQNAAKGKLLRACFQTAAGRRLLAGTFPKLEARCACTLSSSYRGSRCDLLEGHRGPHQAGELQWPNDAEIL